MDRFVAVLTVVALAAAWWWFLYRASAGRPWSPLWMAFSATTSAVLFLAAGATGYTLSKHERFVRGTAWAGSVIWRELAVGAAFLAFALYLWRRGLRSVGQRS